MDLQTIDNRIILLASWVTLLLAFFLSISTAMTNICFVLVALLCLISSKRGVVLQVFKTSNCAKALCLLFLLMLVSVIYSFVAWPVALKYAMKYNKFLLCLFLIPFLLDERQRQRTIWAFILSNIFMVTLSYLQLAGWLHHQYQGDSSLVFHNRIATGLTLCLSSFLLLDKSLRVSDKRKCFFYGVCLAYLLINLIVFNVSRSGILLFFLLLMCYFVYRYRVKGLMLGIGVVIFAVCSVMFLNPKLAHRFQTLNVLTKFHLTQKTSHTSLQMYALKHGPTSSEVRIIFIKDALKIIKQNPFLGIGAGSYEMVNKLVIPQTMSNPLPFYTNNPHNEYLNIMAMLGVVGLVILIAIFVFFYQELLYKQVAKHSLALAIFVIFVAGNAMNAWFLDTTPGHIFAFFMAWLLAERYCSMPTVIAKQPLVFAKFHSDSDVV